MVKAKKYVLRQQFNGWPKTYDLKLIEEELPPLNEGEFLAEAVYLSVDPFMKSFEPTLKIGSTFIGTQVARITESKNKYFPVGHYVTACFGWRTHTISSEKGNGIFPPPVLLPELQDIPRSLGVGILGMPGATAYFGLLKICKPQKGDTVIISGAGTTLGNIAGQIAKIKDCYVIGVTESDDKGKWITDNLGFDRFINYKKDNIEEKLHEYAPNGIDCYFDNIGGEISSKIVNHMKMLGRVAISGCTQNHNYCEDSILNFNKATTVQMNVVLKQLTIEGFLVTRWPDWTEAIEHNLRWIKEGKLKYNESVIEGFHNMFSAFSEMLKESNNSTVVVKIPIRT